MINRVGQQFGNYQLTQLLGRGGFAEVYLGQHIHLPTQAAIKIVTTELTLSEMEQFRNEARLIASLKHPNIVQILDFGLDKKGVPYLVMQHAPDGTLRQKHPKGSRVPLTAILSYVQQIAAALQFAHDKRVVHCDVKPVNMLVGNQNEILLSDFGIAVLAHSERSLHTREVVGTATYMAPEQFRGKPCPASDQYALAIVVYEWLCGTCPFQGDFIQLGYQHCEVLPQPLHEQGFSQIKEEGVSRLQECGVINWPKEDRNPTTWSR